ncbi:MAG: hypothetical protein HY042_02745 [Spirochaetia bacterium]|nr:hypothetical protein [Spirochaetia bacterium]
MRRWTLLLLLSFAWSAAPQCKHDPDPIPAKIAYYALMCPTGKTGCYTNCFNTYDTNANGKIDAAELPDFNACTVRCDSMCDLTSILLYSMSK